MNSTPPLTFARMGKYRPHEHIKDKKRRLTGWRVREAFHMLPLSCVKP